MQLKFNFAFSILIIKKLSDELNESIVPWIGKTGKMLHLFLTEKFKNHNIKLTLEQFVVLRVLHAKDGQPQHDLAFITKRHKASLTRILGTLERKNLVARIPDPADKRVNRIYLTSYGRKFYLPTLPILKEAVDQVQHSLSEEEIDTLINIMKKVQKNLTT